MKLDSNRLYWIMFNLDEIGSKSYSTIAKYDLIKFRCNKNVNISIKTSRD